MISKRQIAKFATQAIIASAVTQASKNTMTNVIDPETDFAEANIETGSKIVGYVVSRKLVRYTDALVDRVADTPRNADIYNVSPPK